MLFNINMTCATKRNKIRQGIGFTPISVKAFDRNDMMDVKIPIAARFITAYLTGVVIAVLRLAFLSAPVRSIVYIFREAAGPIGIILTLTVFRKCVSHTLSGAILSGLSQQGL